MNNSNNKLARIVELLRKDTGINRCNRATVFIAFNKIFL